MKKYIILLIMSLLMVAGKVEGDTPQGSLSANGPFCASGTGQLTWTATSGTGPFTVVYYDGTTNQTATNVTSGIAFNVAVNPVTTTKTYTLVSVTDIHSDVTTSGFTGPSAIIVVNSLPTVTFTSQPGAGPICTNTNITYTTEDLMSNYVWGIPGTVDVDYSIVSGGTSTSNTVTLKYLTSGSKVVTVNYTSGGCSAASPTSSIATTINSTLPTVTFTVEPGAGPECTGYDLTYTTEPGMTNYTWGFPGTAGVDYTITSGGISTSNTVTLKYLSAGSKVVTINYTSGGCTAAAPTSSTSTTLNLSPTVTFTAQPGAGPVCTNTNVTYTTEDLMSNYVWVFPGTVDVDYSIVSGGTSTSNTVTLKYLTSGSKVVTVNYTSGGCTASLATSSTATTVNARPTVTFTAQPGAGPVCTNTNVTYTTEDLMSNYVWGIPGTVDVDYSIVSGGTSTSNTVTLKYLTAGSKVVTINYTSGGCTAAAPTSSTSTTLNLSPTVTFTAQPGAGPVCTNTNVTYTTEDLMSNYVWVFPGTVDVDYSIVSGGTSTSNTVTLKYLTSGSKVVTVNYTSGGCTAPLATSSTATTVNARPTVTFTTQPGAGPVCTNTNVTYTTEDLMSNYVWGIPGTVDVDYSIVSGGTSTSNTVTLKYLTSGSKVVTVNYTNNGCSALSSTSSTATTVNARPTVTFTVQPGLSAVCAETDVTYTTQSGMSNYVWGGFGTEDIDYALVSGGIGSTDYTVTLTWITSGNKTVTINYTESNGCSAASATSSQTTPVNPVPGETIFTAGSTKECYNSPNETYTATSANSTSIVYSVSPSGSCGTCAGTINSSTGVMYWKDTFSGTATITATASNSCGTTSAQRVVTVYPNSVPTPGTISGSSTVCQGSSPTAYTIPADDVEYYTWSVTGSGNSISGTGTTGTVTWGAGFTGNATISVVAHRCSLASTSQSTIVAVTPTVGTPSTPTPSATTICQGSSSSAYTTSASNATSYTWSVTGSGNSISGTGTTGTVTWAAGFSGSATVSVTANGCGTSAPSSTTVTVRPTPTAFISASPLTGCLNIPGPVITFTNTQPESVRITYNINGANQTTIDVNASTTATFFAPASVAGTFVYILESVRYLTAPNCPNTISGSAPVTINSLPVPTISGPATPRITSDNNVYITESGMSNSYIWNFSSDAALISGGGTSANTITLKWNDDVSPSVSVNYTNANGCTATSPTIFNVVVKPLPVASGVTITGTPQIGSLLVGSYTYTDGAGYEEGNSTYQWYRDVTTPIPGADELTFTPTGAEDNLTISFEVIPVSTSPIPNTGVALKSSPTATVSSPGTPVASDVCIQGIRAVGQVLTGKYKYTYAPKDEGASTYRWLINGSPEGSALTYTLTEPDIADDVLITFEVTPVSQSPNEKTGSPVVSYPLARFDMALDTYSEAIDSVVLVADPAGGVFSGTGVTNGIFSPNAVGYLNSPYTLQYQVNIVNPSNTCSQRASKIFTVTQAGTYFDIKTDTVICHDSDPLTIKVKGIPVGARPYFGYGFFFNWDPYVWYDWYGDYYYYNYGDSVTDPRIVSQTPAAGVPYGVPNADFGALPYVDDATTPWTVTIDPKQLSPGSGNNILYLYYFLDYYYYLVQIPLNVESNVIVNRINNLNSQYCADAPEQDIFVDVLYPVGANAIWTGAILSQTAQPVAKLNAATMPPAGSPYTITYQYSSPEGCLSNILTEDVTINPLPDPGFTLNDTYNIDSGAVTMIPVLPPGGSFEGNGVSANKLFPDLAGTGLDIITYSIKDANLCFNDSIQSTIIRKAQGTIVGLPSVVCYRDTTYNVAATGLPPGITVIDFINKKNTIVHTPGSTNAAYNILTAGSGSDTLVFSYLWDNVGYAITTVVNVDSIGEIVINNLLPGDIVCANLPPFELFTSPSGGVFAGPVSGAYLDPTKAMGLTSVSYKYTNIKSGCSATTVVPFKITPPPIVSFAPADVCIESESGTDTTFFINNTVSVDSVTLWQWEFVDPEGSTISNDKNPGYLYNTGSFHTVTLTATTVNNCSSIKVATIDLGIRPLADFYWKNECFVANDSIMLFDTTFSTSSIVSWSWDFSDNGPLHSGKVTKYPKKSTGYLPVRYIVKTSYANCADTVTKNIYIRPTISLASDNYFEDFESGVGDWTKGEESVNSWSFGGPERSVINSAASGQNAWYTNFDPANQKVESSSIVSPCFDFSASVRPMIRLKLWRRFEMNRDGAALQYKIGDAPAWQYIGSLDDGINWYNSTLIKGRPGGDQIGWTTVGTADTKWIESRHSLDELNGKKNVKLRIAYGSDGTSQNNDGIAFDDISIEERTRNILVEHFANTSSIESSEATAMINKIALANDDDIVNIQYHTNFPGIDSFYVNNPGDASARILFYGLTRVPYTFVDGGTRKDFAGIFDYTNSENGKLIEIDGNEVVRRSLISPVLDIKLDSLIVSGGVLTIGGEISALKDTTLANLTLYLVVIEKANSKYSGAAGETTFHNVFRKFVPDAAGISLGKTWTKGIPVLIQDQTWIIQKTLNSSDIEVVAFIQNSVTKEIYQAQSMLKPKITVGIEKPGILNNIDFALYPNPAKSQLTVSFGEILNSETDIFIYDFSGTVVRTYKAGSGEREFIIDDLGLKDGIYLIRVSSGGVSFGYRKLIISGS